MAQLTGVSFLSKWLAKFAPNGVRAITGLFMQEFREDVADSFLNRTDDLVDEDDMASDSASKVPSQQSVKAYVLNTVEAGGVNNTDLKFFEQWDWIGNADVSLKTPPLGWLITSGGTGATWGFSTYGADVTENAFGVIRLATGSATSGYCSLVKGVASLNFGFGNTLKLRMRAALETLGDGTNDYRAWVGFGDSQTGIENSFGAYFRYNYAVNGGRWEAITADGSLTITDTGVAADVLYHIFEIRVNSDASIVTFYIDGVLVATHSTASGHHIPDVGDFVGLQFKIIKLAGTTSRNFHMDYYDFLMTRTTAR